MTAGGAGGPAWVHGPATGELRCLPVDGLPEVVAGDDLAALLAGATRLEDGDIVVVTSKVVSKAEGQVRTAKREEAVVDETERVVARRGRTTIVRTRHGLVMAAAGVDASNTDRGTVVLLPRDPDASARRLRALLARRTGRNVAVLVTDTAGRAWRHGQTDIAIGAAGLDVLHDYAGVGDPHGNELAVTAPAVADELAAAADLVKRKLDRRPAAVLRGLAGLVLDPGDDGPGAVSLVREDASDMFGLGAREAVLSALRAQDPRGFGAACSAVELVEHLARVAQQEPPPRLEGAAPPAGAGRAVVRVEEGARTDAAGGAQAAQPQPAVTVLLEGSLRSQGAAAARVRTAAFALGWQLTEHLPPDAPLPDTESDSVFLRFRPVSP